MVAQVSCATRRAWASPDLRSGERRPEPGGHRENDDFSQCFMPHSTSPPAIEGGRAKPGMVNDQRVGPLHPEWHKPGDLSMHWRLEPRIVNMRDRSCSDISIPLRLLSLDRSCRRASRSDAVTMEPDHGHENDPKPAHGAASPIDPVRLGASARPKARVTPTQQAMVRNPASVSMQANDPGWRAMRRSTGRNTTPMVPGVPPRTWCVPPGYIMKNSQDINTVD